MNIKHTLIATTIILGMTASFAVAGGLGQKNHKQNDRPPQANEQMHKDGTPPPPPRRANNGQGNNGQGNNDQANNGQPTNGQPNGENGGGFRRPVELIGPELGVTGAQFAKCFENVNPAPQGTAPTQAREQANKAVLLPCLQAINPAITNDLLDSVSNKYRPSN